MRFGLFLLLFACVVRAGGWLEENAVAFKTVEAGNGFDDLAFLKKVIGDARIVSLGETTHGSREIFQMKHRLLEFLATEMGFSIFSIEACMPESYAVNDYVEFGKGDPKQLIRGMYFWTWRTEEVRAMVEWMRSFNAAGKGPLRFTGFDMQTPRLAIKNVLAYTGEDPGLKKLYERVEHVSQRRTGWLMARLPVEALRGKRVKLIGKIRTESGAQASLALRADRRKAASNYRQSMPLGSAEWREDSVEVEVDDDAPALFLMLFLQPPGAAYFDDFRIEVDGKPWNDHGLDLGFDKDSLGRWNMPARAARFEKSIEVVDGERCLRFRRTGDIDRFDPVQGARDALKWVEIQPAKQGRTWALQNARVVLQSVQGGGWQGRDRAMADNVEWIVQQNPNAKIVLWAHNGHVARKPLWMGHHLARKFGKDYFPVGFTTRLGTYRGMKRGRGLATARLVPPPVDSWETRLGDLGLPLAMVDLRGAPAELRKEIPMRSIGALVQEQQFYPHPLPNWFDLLIYIEKTSAAVEMEK
ncbi:MAG: erythromycin esterase family protein [Planctomycetota bacterium]|jgi:erythromycin esterase-like protein